MCYPRNQCGDENNRLQDIEITPVRPPPTRPVPMLRLEDNRLWLRIIQRRTERMQARAQTIDLEEIQS
jgi:hypothetical protein